MKNAVYSWWQRTDKPNYLDYILLFTLLALSYATFMYGDIKVTFEHSMNFLDAVFAGKPQDFYQIAIDNSTFGHPAVYDIPLYALFAIWNLPIYLIHQITGFSFLTSTSALLWVKSAMVLATLIGAWLVAKIGREIGLSKSRQKWLVVIFLSSLTVVMPVFVVVQYDIFLVVAMLAGILAYIKGNTKQFIWWFILANTLKLFALFVFIPLLLLKEKRLSRIIGYSFLGITGIIASRLLYFGDSAYKASTGGFTEAMLSRLTATGFQWQYPGYIIPLFVVAMVGIIIFAYVKELNTKKEIQSFAIYTPFAIFLVFCAIVPLNPYWIILLAPFATLIAFTNPKYLKANLLLETAFGFSLLLIYLISGFQMFNNGVFTSLLFSRFVDPANPQRFQSPRDVLAAVGIADQVTFLIGFMIAVAIASLILNFPRKENIELLPNIENIERGVIWIRLGAVSAFLSLLFAFYLIPATPVVYSALSAELGTSEKNLLADNANFTEEITFKQGIKVKTMNIAVAAENFAWLDSSLLHVTLTNKESAETLINYTFPLNAVGTDPVEVPGGGIELQADQTYLLSIWGSNGEETPLLVKVNSEVDNFPTFDNGEKIAGDLAFSIAGDVTD